MPDYSDAIDKILAISQAHKLTDEDGRDFFSKKVYPNVPPMPDYIQVSSLHGIVDWVKTEGKVYADKFVHVCSPTDVQVWGALDKIWMTRRAYVRSTVSKCAFPFGRALDIEEFIISVQCYFCDNPDKKAMINFISQITAHEVATAHDDGIAQTVTVKNEMGRADRASFNPIVELKPYRIFREVQQPRGQFLLRLSKGSEGRLPDVTLHDADGDHWQHEAVQNIYDWLVERLPDGIVVIR